MSSKDQRDELSSLNSEVIALKEMEGYKVFRISNARASNALLQDVIGFKAQDPERIEFFADPVSWAVFLSWIAEKAGEAVVSAVVMTLFNALVFRKDINWEEFARNLMIEFSHILNLQLKQEAMEKATYKMRSHQKLLEAYVRDPQSRAGTLDGLTISVQENVFELQRGGVQAAGPYALGASIDLCVKLERYLKQSSDGEWETYTDAVKEFKQHVVEMHDELILLTQQRFTGFQNTGYGGFVYYLDNKIVWTRSNNLDQARSVYNSHLQRLTQEMLMKIVSPVAGIANQWDRTLARRPQRRPGLPA